jgi:hypothetical protein
MDSDRSTRRALMFTISKASFYALAAEAVTAFRINMSIGTTI